MAAEFATIPRATAAIRLAVPKPWALYRHTNSRTSRRRCRAWPGTRAGSVGVVAELDRPQGGAGPAVARQPALDGLPFAVLLGGAVPGPQELRRRRPARRHDGAASIWWKSPVPPLARFKPEATGQPPADAAPAKRETVAAATTCGPDRSTSPFGTLTRTNARNVALWFSRQRRKITTQLEAIVH